MKTDHLTGENFIAAASLMSALVNGLSIVPPLPHTVKARARRHRLAPGPPDGVVGRGGRPGPAAYPRQGRDLSAPSLLRMPEAISTSVAIS